MNRKEQFLTITPSYTANKKRPFQYLEKAFFCAPDEIVLEDFEEIAKIVEEIIKMIRVFNDNKIYFL